MSHDTLFQLRVFNKIKQNYHNTEFASDTTNYKHYSLHCSGGIDPSSDEIPK